MIKPLLSARSSPVFTGLFLLVLLTACLSPKTVDKVTLMFWQAIANDDLSIAKEYASTDSKNLINESIANKMEKASFHIGEIVINGNQARVETQVEFPDHQKLTFSTFLVKQGQNWRVDYRRSQQTITNDLLNGLFKSLRHFGDNLNKQLQKQQPIFEKEIDSFTRELKKQFDKLDESLEKAFPPDPKKQDPYQNSI